MGSLAVLLGFEAADRLGGGRSDGAGVLAAQVDGDGGVGDVDGDGLPGVDAAEGDLLPSDHDDAGVASDPLGSDRFRGGTRWRLAQNVTVNPDRSGPSSRWARRRAATRYPK